MKAHFPSNLDRQAYHVADVSDGEVMVVVNHTEMLTNLYVSQLKDSTGIHFSLSLEQIFCYFPNSTWMGMWLRLVAHLLRNEAAYILYPHILAYLEMCNCSYIVWTSRNSRAVQLYSILPLTKTCSFKHYILTHTTIMNAGSYNTGSNIEYIQVMCIELCSMFAYSLDSQRSKIV